MTPDEEQEQLQLQYEYGKAEADAKAKAAPSDHKVSPEARVTRYLREEGFTKPITPEYAATDPKLHPELNTDVLAPNSEAQMNNPDSLLRKFLRYSPASAVPAGIADLAQQPEKESAKARAALAGATLNLAPRITAASEAGDVSGPGYEKQKQAYQNLYRKAVDEHPAENVAGGLALPFPGGAAESGVAAVGRVAAGGGYGGLSSYFGGDDLTNPDLGQIAGGISAGAGGALLGEGLNQAAPLVRRFAGNQAAKAIGIVPGAVSQSGEPLTPALVNKLKAQGAVANTGNAILDRGLPMTHDRQKIVNWAEDQAFKGGDPKAAAIKSDGVRAQNQVNLNQYDLFQSATPQEAAMNALKLEGAQSRLRDIRAREEPLHYAKQALETDHAGEHKPMLTELMKKYVGEGGHVGVSGIPLGAALNFIDRAPPTYSAYAARRLSDALPASPRALSATERTALEKFFSPRSKEENGRSNR